jgi:two-component system chemotaxis response regulator CheY
MEKLFIVCVEDQREVLNTVSEQLSVFEDYLTLEECESADEAEELIEEIDSNGDFVAVVISDHVMPGKSGVDFLIDIKEDGRFKSTKKILLTGQATHVDTILAINQAGIDNYVEKPWEAADLREKVSRLLTEFIIEKGLDYEPFIKVLDKQKLFNLLK